MMKDNTALSPAMRSFETALLCGEARGYAVCAKPLRFARLPDTVATTFAELGDENCYYVFESEAEANRRLAQIPPEDHLGWDFSVREVLHLASPGQNDGPKLDLQGHPFAMRGFVVETSGTTKEWVHPGRLGWRGPTTDGSVAVAGQNGPGLLEGLKLWVRRLLGK